MKIKMEILTSFIVHFIFILEKPMENKQTSVEFIKLKLEQYGDPQYCEITWVELDELINQAKQMEKEQHDLTFARGVMTGYANANGYESVDFEQYYEKTYGIHGKK